MAAPACLTCTRITEIKESVPICSHESVQSALSKYFWFNDEESTRGILCQPCWHKIDDFHKFYCEIERLHSHHRQQYPIQLLQVKQEVNHDSLFIAELQEDPHMDVNVKIKCELEEEAEDGGCDDDDNEDDYGEIPGQDETSDDDYHLGDVDETDPIEQDTLKSKTSPRKYKKLSKEERTEIDRFISTNINLQCDSCLEIRPSFKDLQCHSETAHGKRAYLFCCERRFCHWSRLIDHIRFHLDPDRFVCTKCSKRCPSNEALTSHMTIKHATDEEKTFQCDVCPKKFSRLRLLNMHKKRHPA